MKLRTLARAATKSRVKPRTAVLIGLGISQASTMATTIYLHRGLAHNAVQYTPRTRAVLELAIRTTTGIEPNQWAAIHQQHHAHTDEIGDPHSPLLTSIGEVQIHNVRLYQAAAKTEPVLRRQAVLDRNHPSYFPQLRGWRGLTIGIGTAVIVFGPIPGAIISFVHWPSYIMLNASINAWCHAAVNPKTIDKQSYLSRVMYRSGWLLGNRETDTPDTSLNIPLWALFTGGEGLHNNHHAAPQSPVFARRPSDIDFGWLVIRGLKQLGLASADPLQPASQAA